MAKRHKGVARKKRRVGGCFKKGNMDGLVKGSKLIPDDQNGNEGDPQQKCVPGNSGLLDSIGETFQHGQNFSYPWSKGHTDFRFCRIWRDASDYKSLPLFCWPSAPNPELDWGHLFSLLSVVVGKCEW